MLLYAHQRSYGWSNSFDPCLPEVLGKTAHMSRLGGLARAQGVSLAHDNYTGAVQNGSALRFHADQRG